MQGDLSGGMGFAGAGNFIPLCTLHNSFLENASSHRSPMIFVFILAHISQTLRDPTYCFPATHHARPGPFVNL